MMKLKLDHVKLLIEMRNRNFQITVCGAQKARLLHELNQFGLVMHMDEQEWFSLSPTGERFLNNLEQICSTIKT